MGGKASKPTSPLQTNKKSIKTIEPIREKGLNGSKRIESPYFTKIINNESPLIRLDHSDKPHNIQIQGVHYDYKLKYVYASQRGYYPDDPDKANQDSYLICEKILSSPSCNLFGIFDGHGSEGDKCSFFAADELPDSLVKILNKKGGLSLMDGNKMSEVYSKAFVDTNKLLHNSNVEDLLSGTTAITILQKGDKLLVANVGDSRAIIACLDDRGQLVYQPLSSDQTPYRKDERDRLKKAGAIIRTIDMIEGNEPVHENFGTDLGNDLDEDGDPPRVWDQTLEKPGCAFSRSIGDHVAKSVGVTSEPEILEWTLTPRDKFAIVASDGVFEFITSQSVVDMVAKFTDPIEAAKQVLAESYRLWLTFDERTDDITMIIIYFDDFKQSSAISSSGQLMSTAPVSVLKRNPSFPTLLQENKPVRKAMSKQRREDISEQFDLEGKEDTIDFTSLVDPKSEQEKDRIDKILSNNFMFQNLTMERKAQLLKAITARVVQKGDRVIGEGEPGNEMYIVDSGDFLVYKRDISGVDQVVFTYSVVGNTFGELSLMYGKPRSASVVAHTDGKLWCISRAAFRSVILKANNEHQRGLVEIFLSVPVIADLSITALHRMCLLCKEYSYSKNDLIVNESSLSTNEWHFAIIKLGMVRLIAKDEGKKRQLRDSSMFFSVDEIGSKFSEARADTALKLVCVSEGILKTILSPQVFSRFQETMNNKKNKGKRRGSLASTATLSIEDINASPAQAPSLGAVTLIFNNPDYLTLPKVLSKGSYQFISPVALLGSFGFVGNFQIDATTSSIVSVKVVVKADTVSARMDARIMKERNILAALTNKLLKASSQMSHKYFCLASASGTYSDDKWLYMVYRDRFACDLSLALSEHTLPPLMKVLTMACVYAGLNALHELGLMYRFLNSGSVYLTVEGIPKLTDFRYAKCMDGSLSFTICGDPLYFAPEMVAHKGYDYSVDLWAMGILLYELYEDCSPFGNSDTEETAIFKKISLYNDPHSLVFTDKTPANAQNLIKNILHPDSQSRIGYQSIASIQSSSYFADIDWLGLHQHRCQPVDLEPSLGVQHLLDDEQVQVTTHRSSVFAKF